MTNQEIEGFFKKLIEECSKNIAYSIIEAAEKMGIKYEQVQEWARSNEKASNALEFCRMCCACNIEEDTLKFKLSNEDFVKYMCENDDEFKAHHEKRRKEEWLAEKERNGEEVIEETNIMIEDNAEKTDVESKELINAEWWKNRRLVEEERVRQWVEKDANTSSSIAFEDIKREDNTRLIGVTYHKEDLTEFQKSKLYNSTMCAATGSASKEYAKTLFAQAMSGLFGTSNVATSSEATLEALLALKPGDEIEGMIISRIIVLHNQYMEFMRRACGPTQTTAGVDMNINRATKLMRLYNESLETLNRYRRKGQQKITVQHVNVSEGGQAIIGNVEAGGGDNAKN